ncbi:hypothetical protein KFE25_003536 [Diacronema lutheri]|uniref:Protein DETOXIFICATION n=1 Tax=Diacronema lutheri TaxID=2081491 RepID=A0A8J5XHR9_DIALT|nr:hypothetical protein KFE25_003536 [Diacronema lutheri]
MRARDVARRAAVRAASAFEPDVAAARGRSLAPLRSDVSDVLLIALPALGTCLMLPLGALVDAWALGRLTPGGDPLVASAALAALEANSAIFGFAEGSFAFVAVAMTRVVGARACAGELARARAVRTGLVLAACAGVSAAAALLVRRDALLSRLFGLARAPELLASARAYFAIRALALPAIVTSSASSGACVALRAVPTRAYAFPLAARVLVAALLVSLGGGLRGVALATVASAWLQLALLLAHLRAQLPAMAALRWRASGTGSGVDSDSVDAAAVAPRAAGITLAAAETAAGLPRLVNSTRAAAAPPAAGGSMAASSGVQAWISVSGAALVVQLLTSAAWAAAGRAVSRSADVQCAAAYHLLGEACHFLACTAAPLSLAAQGLLPAALAGGDGARVRRLLALLLTLAAGVGCAGGTVAVFFGGAAPALLCADAAVCALLQRTAALGALTVFFGAINQALYGCFVGLGWLRAFVAMNGGGALIALWLIARIPPAGGAESLLAVWRAIVSFSALKALLGLAQLPALARRTLSSEPTDTL